MAYYLGGFGGPHPAFDQVAAFTAAGFLLLPAGLLFHQPAFVLNGPLWSLFFEFFANAVYFVQTQRGKLSRALLLAVLTCGAAALVLLIGQAGTAAAIGFASPGAFAAGAVRVLYSFSAGVFIHRFLPYQKLGRLPAWLLTAVLVLELSCAGAQTARYDRVAILVMMPAMVALGANVAESPRYSGLWRFAGALSYPLYVLQEPVLRGVFALFHAAGLGAQPVMEAMTGTAASVLVAYAALVCYDEPLRKGKKAVAFLKKSSAKNFY
jgi:peptidoglycan/LPS O-acetylase OafA/YrhL